MSRDVPFDKDARCDNCGAVGAYDFMSDYLCPACAEKNLDSEAVSDGELARVINAR